LRIGQPRAYFSASRKGKKERDEKETIMKTTLNSLLITAAGFALSAAAAYGQTHLTANIPFSFQTASGMQAAGEYRVVPVSSDGSMMKLQNVNTGHVTTTGIGRPHGNPNEKAPQLVFKCGSESGCALVAVKIADGRGWSYSEPKLKASEQERIAVVYFDSKLAE
jgi:hypothetical protein